MKRDWDKMDESLRRGIAEGLTGLEIANRLAQEFDDIGLTRSAVIARIKTIGLKLLGKSGKGGRGKTVWSEERIAFLKAKAAEGWASSRIATEMGLAVNSVTAFASDQGIRFDGPRPLVRASAVQRFNPSRPRPPAKEKPKPSPAKPLPPPKNHKPKNVPFARLDSKVCKWPLNSFPPYRFCGVVCEGDGPYCDWHDSVAHGRTGQARRA